MRKLWDDLRLAFRGLRRWPGFAAAVVATLALGIGGNVALFSVVDGVLLRPLPYPDPDRMVIVWENDRLRGTDREGASAPDYLDLVEQSRSFETMAARTRQNRTLGTAAEPVHVSSARVTSTYFPLLGVRPFRTDPRAADEQPGVEPVLVLPRGSARAIRRRPRRRGPQRAARRRRHRGGVVPDGDGPGLNKRGSRPWPSAKRAPSRMHNSALRSPAEALCRPRRRRLRGHGQRRRQPRRQRGAARGRPLVTRRGAPPPPPCWMFGAVGPALLMA